MILALLFFLLLLPSLTDGLDKGLTATATSIASSRIQPQSLHRKHSVQWDILTREKMTEWYQPWELCMLYSNKSIEILNKHTVHDCIEEQIKTQTEALPRKKHKRAKNQAIGNGRFFCKMGHVYHNMPCVTSTNTTLTSMTHFFKSVHGYDDPKQHYLTDMMRSLTSARGGLIFTGDSTLRLFMDAFKCEFVRQNIAYDAMTRKDFSVLPPYGSQYYRIRGPDSEVKVVYKQSNKLQLPDLEILNNYAEYFMNTPVHSLGEGWGGDGGGVLGSHDSVVLVMQAGTWYGDSVANVFKQHMDAAFSAVFNLVEKYALRRKHISFVWAEQVAQHWPTHNGYFQHQIKEDPPIPFCSPLDNNVTVRADWRNDIIWESFLKDGTPWRQKMESLAPFVRVHVLNFRALTRDMSDLHVRQNNNRDCTHYCYTPMMYQSIYHQLAKIAAEMAADVAASDLNKEFLSE